MNEINLALHQHNTSRNHSTTATQGAASRSSDNGEETSGRPRVGAGAHGRRRACVAAGARGRRRERRERREAGGGGRGRRRERVEAAGEGGGGRGRRFWAAVVLRSARLCRVQITHRIKKSPKPVEYLKEKY